MRSIAVLAAAAAGLLAPPVVVAQQSAHYRITQSALNAGGHSTTLAATGGEWRASAGALGDAALGPPLAGPSYRVEAGFLTGVRPPGEVDGVRFSGKVELVWAGESSTGSYDVYRSRVDRLPHDYGECLRSGLTSPATTDATLAPAGRAYFYLVTAVNRLGEEGTRGDDSTGTERPRTSACP